LSIAFLFDENPGVTSLALSAQRSETRESCQIVPLARTQSEGRRRLALVGDFGASDRLE
jgi:hypothetical protein